MTEMLLSPDASVITRLDMSEEAATARFTGLAVFDGSQWASLCLELDIASCGDTWQEALFNLEVAVREARAIAGQEGLIAGAAVPEAAIEEFLSGHRGSAAIASATITA